MALFLLYNFHLLLCLGLLHIVISDVALYQTFTHYGKHVKHKITMTIKTVRKGED